MAALATREAVEREVWITSGAARLAGDLALPAGAPGIVLFAHGSGSSRHSSRNRFVARSLNQAGLGTLLMDLLTTAEEREDAATAQLRFDIELLAKRLEDAVDWLAVEPATRALPIGCFGASTGAAAALAAAAERPRQVKAVVSRGGRPDLALRWMDRVAASVLLIVGGSDTHVITLNRSAFDALHGTHKELVIVPGASHLFEEPGALEQVARLATDWFSRWLRD